MNDSSSMMLIGIGGGGSAIARGVRRAFGEGLRFAESPGQMHWGGAGGWPGVPRPSAVPVGVWGRHAAAGRPHLDAVVRGVGGAHQVLVGPAIQV